MTSAANQIYDGMHNIIRQLRPGSLDNLGLSETIKDEMNKWQSQHPSLKVNLIIKGFFFKTKSRNSVLFVKLYVFPGIYI